MGYATDLANERFGNMGLPNYGVDQNMLSREKVPGFGGPNQATYKPDTYNTVYEGPGGKWTNSGSGWVNSSGQRVSDLAGFLNMQKQRNTGADFSAYQGLLNNQLQQQQQANNQYQRLLQDPNAIQQTAGYKFALDQGNQAINRSAAAKGMLGSGNVLAELAKYGQGLASQQYQTQLGNVQQNLQNQNTQANTLASLMQGAQNFGLQSGYYEPPQNYNIPGGKMIKPSVW